MSCTELLDKLCSSGLETEIRDRNVLQLKEEQHGANLEDTGEIRWILHLWYREKLRLTRRYIYAGCESDCVTKRYLY